MVEQRTSHIATRGLWQVYTTEYANILPNVAILTRGMAIQQPSTPAFSKANVDQDPVPKVDVKWVIPSGFDPLGFRVYRGAIEGFVPNGETAGSGNCLADESTLGPAVTTWTDLNVLPGETWFYKIAFVVEA
jgi:hypothetical protein